MIESEQRKDPLFIGLSAGPLRYQACVVQICNDTISVLKNYSVSRDKMAWDHFIKTIEQDFPDQDIVKAMDFDDNCVGFYNFDIPLINENQMPSVIASQAEIHFPLPIEQMRYHWQILDQKDETVMVAVAAAKETILN